MLSAYGHAVILEPGFVLPAQLFAPPANLLPEQRLMLAVLEDAVTCLQRFVRPVGRREQYALVAARRWFLSNDDAWPFSCVNICAALKINLSYLRRGLAPWLHDGGRGARVTTPYRARRCSGSRTRATPLRAREGAQPTYAML